MRRRIGDLQDLTVGIPLRNEQVTIENAVTSAIAGGAGIVIVSDNASTDASREVVCRLQRREPRVKLISLERNLGPLRNFSLVLSLASTKYFAWLGAHDTVTSGYYGKLLRELQASDAGLAFGVYSDNPNHYDPDEVAAFADRSPSIRVQQFMQKPQDGAMFHGVFATESLKVALARHPSFEIGDGSLLLEFLSFERATCCFDAFYVRKQIETQEGTYRHWARQYRGLQRSSIAYPKFFIPPLEMYRGMRMTYRRTVDPPDFRLLARFSIVGPVWGAIRNGTFWKLWEVLLRLPRGRRRTAGTPPHLKEESKYGKALNQH